MTNEEAIYQLNVMACGKTIFEEFDIKALSIAINSIQEKAKLKAEIEQLKSELEQSVKLPYLAGTPLYFAFSKQGIVKDKIRRWQINEHGIVFYSKGSAYPVEFIGKYAFLTREEAEQSLKGQVRNEPTKN